MTRRILMGVTSDISITLMSGFPQHLTEHGWDVHVVSSAGPRLTALADAPGVTVHPLKMRRDPAPLDDLRSLARWYRLLREVRPDVVSVGTPKAGLLGGLAGVLARVPVRVYMLRGLRYETADGAGRAVLVALERIAVACAHRVIAVSSTLRDVAVEDGLGPRRTFHVIGAGSSNGVDVDRFATTPQERAAARMVRWPDAPDLPTVGFVGRIHPDKGLDLLADAVAVLSAHGVRARLLVVGASDDPAGDAIMERLSGSGWDVEHTGSVEDVAPLLRLMDMLCLPTRREGFPNVVLEAASAGIPTVATLATGVPDAVVDGETGVIVHERSAVELARAIRTLIEDPTTTRRMGRRARDRADAEFRRATVWASYEAFYHSAVHRSATSVGRRRWARG